MENEQLYKYLTEIDNLRENMSIVAHVLREYAIHTDDDPSVFNKTVTTLAECIDMYVARLEVATERALKEYHDGEAAA